MKSETISSNGFSQYILTLTLYEHLCAFKRVGLKIPSREFVDVIEMELLSKIRQIYQGSKTIIETIRFGDFCDEIVSLAKGIKDQMSDAVVVSTTPMITYDTGGICIGLSRLIDIHGNILGIGSRVGYNSINRQLEQIAKDISGRRVIVMEDGSFTGSTLCFLLDKLAEKRAHVVAVVMGILFPKAKSHLASSFQGKLLHRYDFEKPVEWMPSHDFFPFIPNAGRVLGTKVGESLVPLYMFDRSTLSKPYVLPYGRPDKWASLPVSLPELVKFSRSCIMGSMRIFQEMERLNGKTIRVEDLIGSRPVTSVPLPTGQGEIDFYNASTRVVDMLNASYDHPDFRSEE